MSATLSIYFGSFDLIKKFESAIANMKGKFAFMFWSLCGRGQIRYGYSQHGYFQADTIKDF